MPCRAGAECTCGLVIGARTAAGVDGAWGPGYALWQAGTAGEGHWVPPPRPDAAGALAAPGSDDMTSGDPSGRRSPARHRSPPRGAGRGVRRSGTIAPNAEDP